mmetsp:Transcript_976/g.2116  ORF Transcript_976/g.2116 Transcript_976/m.2116 type:complete len:568 (+) Transcript_976:33-1736(+)
MRLHRSAATRNSQAGFFEDDSPDDKGYFDSFDKVQSPKPDYWARRFPNSGKVREKPTSPRLLRRKMYPIPRVTSGSPLSKSLTSLDYRLTFRPALPPEAFLGVEFGSESPDKCGPKATGDPPGESLNGDIRSNSGDPGAYSQEHRTSRPESNPELLRSNTCERPHSREARSRSREARPNSREAHSHSREARPLSHSRESRPHSRGSRPCSRESRPHSRESRPHSRESRPHSRESPLRRSRNERRGRSKSQKFWETLEPRDYSNILPPAAKTLRELARMSPKSMTPSQRKELGDLDRDQYLPEASRSAKMPKPVWESIEKGNKLLHEIEGTEQEMYRKSIFKTHRTRAYEWATMGRHKLERVYQSRKEKKRIHTVFMSLNPKAGAVEAAEILTAFEMLGLELSEEMLMELISQVDILGDGKLGPKQFGSLLKLADKEDSAGQLRYLEPFAKAYRVRSTVATAVFKIVDTDGSGLIDEDELYAAMKHVGYKYTRACVRSLMKKVDTAGRGLLSQLDFVRLLNSLEFSAEDKARWKMEREARERALERFQAMQEQENKTQRLLGTLKAKR